MDPFATLELPPRFDLPQSEIERRYRELQRALHPDRFASAPPSERRLSLSKAIEVNEAYRVLRDDVARGKALLARRGYANEPQQPADPAFLMAVMERREALSEARRAKDLGAVRRLSTEVSEERDRVRARVVTLFGEDARGEAIAEELAALRYWRRFLDEAASIEEELG